jgi:2-hydroxychromene-2-carboxylate isomerase
MDAGRDAGAIRFCFDYVSPYAYLAWTQIHALAGRLREARAVEPFPVLFAALLDANGQKGPAEIPAKRAYLFKDCVRLAHGFGVPFAPPPAHPFNPLLALRITSLPMAGEARRALCDRIFAAIWGGGRGADAPAEVAEAARAAGLDGDAMVRLASAPEAKDRVRRQTEEALAAGAFGVPTMIADGELFWGVDALPHLEAFLEGRDPVTPAMVARWAGLPAAAHRRAVAVTGVEGQSSR